MGLAQTKTRRKIGKDPNNTKWTKDTDSFGQRILRSQGWEPGQYLGAKDAAHAVHHTAANASFIRVSLKDDMLGLGFKQARDDRVTGMDVFQDLLGRLNGKSTEAIDKERQARAQLKSTLYCDTKFGPMRFVSGGWLVGDQVTEDPDAAPKEEESKDDVKMEDIPVKLEGSDKKSKKRKAEESNDASSSSGDDEKAMKKRRKEEKKAAKKLEAAAGESGDAAGTEKNEKKRKSKSSKEDATEDTPDDVDKKAKKKKKEKKDKAEKESDDEADSEDNPSKKKRKKEKSGPAESDADKAARREEKRRRKEEKRAKKEASRESSSTPAATGTSTPTGSGASTPMLRGHHAVRSRWIAQKRMATMDDKALNQIFMIKSQS